jgi:hypothetical protein
MSRTKVSNPTLTDTPVSHLPFSPVVVVGETLSPSRRVIRSMRVEGPMAWLVHEVG